MGKTSFFNRYFSEESPSNYIPTIGVDFKLKKLNIGSKQIKLQIWDTAGQEKYRSICNIYYKAADIIVLMFDMTNPVGLEEKL